MAPDAWHRSRSTQIPLGQLAGEMRSFNSNIVDTFLSRILRAQNCSSCPPGEASCSTLDLCGHIVTCVLL
eukprot:7553678-Prorocentrum_lima.AAC.1